MPLAAEWRIKYAVPDNVPLTDLRAAVGGAARTQGDKLRCGQSPSRTERQRLRIRRQPLPASAKGIGIAADCSRQLTKENITVISGYAAGTDLAAHKSALENGGNTVFVLAEGILRYSKKREIRDYLNSSNHVFISQFMPKTTWNAGNAMRRNSVIIGLSLAMILVESGKTGGTFAAGEEALRVGCPLFVIDFAQPEVSAEANPYFIAAGGKPIRGKNGIPNITKVLDAVKNDPRSETQPLPVNDAQQLKFDI